MTRRERIARWIVRKLMPGYTVQSKIEIRQAAKTVVKLRLEKEGIII